MAVAEEVVQKKTLAHDAYDEAFAEHAKFSAKTDFFHNQRAEVLRKVESLTHEFDAACRAYAAGDGTDPAPIKVALEAQNSKLHGLSQLYAETSANGQASAERLQRAKRLLQEERWSQELAELTGAVVIADAAAVAARQAADRAGGILSDAIRARDTFNRRIERERKEQF